MDGKKKMDGWDYYIKKKVFLILKNKRVYSGIIESVENVGNGLVWIKLRDKFNKIITFTTNEIDVCEEE
jgi:small nuclear ribonucleoprotein (snRNP)-like protein